MTDPSQRIQDIKSRAEKATKGPWKVERDSLITIKPIVANIICESPDERFVASYKKWGENANFIAHAHIDIPWLIAQLDASLSRERALREALTKAMDPRPAKQCPNCGDWVHLGDCNHTSSTRQSTLYGVCKKCADRHAAFGAALQGKG